MALADNAANAATRFASLPIARQLGLLFGLAASVALGVAVVLWSQEPAYMPLYSQLSPRDAADVVDLLQRNAIAFKIDQTHGTVMVVANEVQAARMKLAAEGLPRSNSASTEFFAGSNGFNTSQFMENARYKQLLEQELARTISQFHDIKSARVLLAIPKESAFVRDNREPSASVFIDVYSGLEIKKQTIASIINLVASSIPNLSASKVTVVDQNGQLLSEGAGQTLFSNTERFMDYRQTLEQQYAQKIQDILTPILGFGRVKAKVAADVDFTSYEQTQEMYNPDQLALRSEQLMEEKRKIGEQQSGVPGSLSNSPQQNASLQQRNTPQGQPAPQNTSNQPNTSDESINASDYHKQTTKNFELDKTISHTRNQPGVIKRLTVAVLVDNHMVYDEKTKKMVSTPLKPEEITQIKTLVADAIGLNTNRGDSLNVINSNFVKPEPIAPIPDLHFWQKDWFWSVLKQIGGALLVLGIIFGLLRPLFRNLAGPAKEEKPEVDPAALTQQGNGMLPAPNDYEGQLALLRQVVGQEPKRVAQVVKTWVERG